MKKNNSPLSIFLNQPYPFYYQGTKLLEISSIVFMVALFFNYLLQPFNVNPAEQKMNYFWISVLHSSTPIIVLLGLAFVYSLFPKTTDNWTIKKEIVYFLGIIFFTGLSQFLIRDLIYTNEDNWSWRYLTEELSNTFIAGLFLGPIIISINLNRQQFKNRQKAESIASSFPEIKKIDNHQKVTIETEVKSEKFTFEIQDFIYAKAEGNYAEIYLNTNGKQEKLVKRIPIKNLEAQLSCFSFICKTHRSILLNLKQIQTISGNAQGYKITLKESEETVPVSRNYIRAFEEKTANLQ